MGCNGAASGNCNNIYDYAIVYDTNLAISPTVPDLSGLFEYDYVGSTVNLPSMPYPGAGTLQEFTNVVATQTNGANQVWNDLYYNGAAWVSSDGSLGQSNNVAEILTNIATFPASDTLERDIIFESSNTQQDISNLVVTYTGQIYPTTIKSAITTAIDTEEIVSIDFSETIAGSDTLTYTVEKQSVLYYWSGTAWVVSNETFGQTNTSDDMVTNITALNDDDENTYKFKAYYVSDDGSTTPILTSIIVVYSDGAIALVTVTGIQYRHGTVSDSKIYVSLSESGVETLAKNQINSFEESITPVNGEWSVTLPATESMDGTPYYTFNFDKVNKNTKVNKYIAESSEDVPFNELEDA